MSTAATIPQTSTAKSLLTWKDPVKSGKVFGGIIAFLLVVKFFTITALLSFFTAVILGGSAIAEYAGKTVTGTGFVTKYKPAYSTYLAKNADVYGAKVSKVLSNIETVFQDLIYSKDIEVTFKTAGVFYILYKLTSWFSLWTLTFLTTVIAFTIPAAYLKNQKQVDEAVAKYSKVAKDKVFEYQSLAKEKATPYLENASTKLGPVGSFIKSKLPVRTAGSTVGEKPVKSTTATTTPIVPSTTTTTTTPEVKLPQVPTSEIQTKIDAAVETAEQSISESKEKISEPAF